MLTFWRKAVIFERFISYKWGIWVDSYHRTAEGLMGQFQCPYIPDTLQHAGPVKNTVDYEKDCHLPFVPLARYSRPMWFLDLIFGLLCSCLLPLPHLQPISSCTFHSAVEKNLGPRARPAWLWLPAASLLMWWPWLTYFTHLSSSISSSVKWGQ